MLCELRQTIKLCSSVHVNSTIVSPWFLLFKKTRLYYLQELMNVKVFSGVSTTVTWDDTPSQSLMLHPIRSVNVIEYNTWLFPSYLYGEFNYCFLFTSCQSLQSSSFVIFSLQISSDGNSYIYHKTIYCNH